MMLLLVVIADVGVVAVDGAVAGAVVDAVCVVM